MRSAEPSARNCDANDLVRSAEPSARSHDVVRSAVTSDFPDNSNATDVVQSAVTLDVPHISDATDVVRVSQDDATLIDISYLNAVNVPTPP